MKKPTKKQLHYWKTMIGLKGNGFQKGHKEFGSVESHKKQGLAMINNQYAKGNKISKESILKRNETRRMNGWNKHPLVTKIKQSSATKKFFSFLRNREKWSVMNTGDKNPCYVDGSSKNPYPREFNSELKLKIRKRDNFICCKCGRTEREELDELNRVLCVNHIDFNKNNCKEENLNPLCLKCNVDINNNRKYWTEYFQTLQYA